MHKFFFLPLFLFSCGIDLQKLNQAPSALRIKKSKLDSISVRQDIKLVASYESLKFHLLEKSCLNCHGKESSVALKTVDLSTKEMVIKYADDIYYSITEGQETGILPMPPLDSSSPIPSMEVGEVFKKWMDLNYVDG